MKYKGITIIKRSDNRYQASIQRKGIRKYIYAKSQKECCEKLKAELNNQHAFEKQAKTCKLYEWLDYFLVTYKSECKSKENEVAVRLHIKPNIKNVDLNKLTTNHIQELLNKISLTRTAVTSYNVLNSAFNCAVANNLMFHNPCAYVNKPKHSKNKGEALTIEEEEDFLQKIKGHNCEKIMLFLLYSGARRSEAINLEWQDIDFKKNKIHIRGTKTKKSNRYIPIFPKLQSLFETMLPGKDTQKVFDYTSADSITRAFIRFDIKGHKLHDLRHTFATRCVENGISMKYIQKWLGHSSYAVTADIYSHATNDKLEREFSDMLK